MANMTTKQRIMAMLKRRPHTCAEVAKKLAVKSNYAWVYLQRMYAQALCNRGTDESGKTYYYPATY